MSYLSEQAIIAKLQRLVKIRGQRQVAGQVGVYSNRLGEFLSGKRRLSKRVISALGYDPSERYYRKRVTR